MPSYSTDAVKSIEEILKQGVCPTDLYHQVNTEVAADFLDVSTRRMEDFRREGDGPKFIKLAAKCVRYRIIDLIEYQQSRLVENNIQAKALVTGGQPLEAA